MGSVVDHILQKSYTLYTVHMSRFRTYKSARPPQKNLGEEGPQTDKQLPPSLFRGQFLDDDSLFCLLCVLSFRLMHLQSVVVIEKETTLKGSD